MSEFEGIFRWSDLNKCSNYILQWLQLFYQIQFIYLWVESWTALPAMHMVSLAYNSEYFETKFNCKFIIKCSKYGVYNCYKK